MQLTNFTDYGLRALMRLASAPERLFTTAEIAREFRLSRAHLMKIVRCLSEAGIVETLRGQRGGFRLARPAASIRLGDVVRALGESFPMVECFRSDGGDCALWPGCMLKARLSRAAGAFIADLNRSTLADIAWPPRGRSAA
ncbi:MAG: Rrf2 family transcriptional regulator [Bauldia sp.]|nr:Rrf2 family transcriptional regulator [Bauldia sp.]